MQNMYDRYNAYLSMQLSQLFVWIQKVRLDIGNVEDLFIVEELVAEVPMVNNIVANEVFLRNTIKCKLPQILAHVATNIEKLLSRF